MGRGQIADVIARGLARLGAAVPVDGRPGTLDRRAAIRDGAVYSGATHGGGASGMEQTPRQLLFGRDETAGIVCVLAGREGRAAENRAR